MRVRNRSKAHAAATIAIGRNLERDYSAPGSASERGASARKDHLMARTIKLSDNDFEGQLARLVAAYEQGRLVPFLGSGMSVPNCRPWDLFVGRLAALAKEPPPKKEKAKDPDKSEVLIRRANAIVRGLKLKDAQGFASNVRKALWTRKRATPAATAELARLWWPLVLSTNYDDLFLQAFRTRHRSDGMEVLGRSESDCQRILTALRMPSHALLWALQGYLGGPTNGSGQTEEHLASELVIGHQEYRRVTHRLVHFRRAFAEVYRHRQLLFLGSGLKEPYFRELFEEIQEIYGSSIHLHYAFIKRGEVDPAFMEANYQIRVIEYDDHAQVPRWIARLHRAVERERFKPVRWSYAFRSEDEKSSSRLPAHLELVRGPLPAEMAAGECLAVSAGGKGRDFFFSRSIEHLLEKMGLSTRSLELVESPTPGLEPMVARFGDQPVYAVRARLDGDRYSADVIGVALMELLSVAERNGHKRILTQLLAAGGSTGDMTVPVYRRRPFPARFALTQMVWAYPTWLEQRKKRSAPPQLSVHIVDPSIYMELASGRLDVLELLTAPADLRFWVEIIWPGGTVEHHVADLSYTYVVRHITSLFNIPLQGWEIEVIPPAREDRDVFKLSDPNVSDDWIVRLGVVPGSTMRFRRASS